MSDRIFAVKRSDQPGTRGPLTRRDAERELDRWMREAPKDATLSILRPDGSQFRVYRWTMADDGYAGWHVQDDEEGER